MLMMPVDLFGAYTKGREYAIDRNWNDLSQGAKVENQWLNNDLTQLKRDHNAATFQNAVDVNGYATTGAAIANTANMLGAQGTYANVQRNSANAIDDYQAYLNNQAVIQRSKEANLRGNAEYTIGASGQRGAQGIAMQNLVPEYQAGVTSMLSGQYKTADITGRAAPAVAQQNVDNQEEVARLRAAQLRAEIARLNEQLNQITPAQATEQNWVQQMGSYPRDTVR